MAVAVVPASRAVVDLDAAFRAHATALLRLAVVLTGDRALAEELVQDAFVRLHRAAPPPANAAVLAYLRRTVINLSHSHHRHLRVVRAAPSDPPPDAEAADADAVRRDGQHRIASAVRALPDRQRDCVVLRYFADLSDAEIAAALDIRVGSVKTHLHRARKALAPVLEDLR